MAKNSDTTPIPAERRSARLAKRNPEPDSLSTTASAATPQMNAQTADITAPAATPQINAQPTGIAEAEKPATPRQINGRTADTVTPEEPAVFEANRIVPPQETTTLKAAIKRPRLFSIFERAAKKARTVDQSTGLQRPLPWGVPEVWSESRSAMCETLPYYRAYQSTNYFSGNICYALMLSNDSVRGAYMDDEVVITRAGGSMGADEEGNSKQQKDHSYDKADVKAVMNSMRKHVAVVVIAAKDNAQCPTQLQHEYNVLGHFQITDVWSEKNEGHHCIRYRLEKINLGSRSWWVAESTEERPKCRDYTRKAAINVCSTCSQPSLQVYKEKWMCLQENCKMFWQDNNGNPPRDFTYNPDFLEQRQPWPEAIQPPWSLRPPLPEARTEDLTAGYTRNAWKGIVCPKCGCCVPRSLWTAWSCKTPECGFTHRLRQPLLSTNSVFREHEQEWDGTPVPVDTVHPLVTELESETGDGWRISTYRLLEGNTITHFQANKVVNNARNGPNDLFSQMQSNNIGLQRFPMKNAMGKGESLASHFSVNFGMPYKYVVATESKSFGEAPDVILAALARLDWAGRKSTADFKSFNELLAVGYFEGSKMGYHDDGEDSLGPTVATLSLGAFATMSIRMKKRYFGGLTKSDVYDPTERVLPGSFLEQQRRAFNAECVKDPSISGKEAKKILYSGKKIPPPPVLVKMELRHGDMVVMHGAEMQKYFEHEVIPDGKLRFALTSRFVKPEKVTHEDHWKGEVGLERQFQFNGIEMSSTNAAPANNRDPAFMPSSSPLSNLTTAGALSSPDVELKINREAASAPSSSQLSNLTMAGILSSRNAVPTINREAATAPSSLPLPAPTGTETIASRNMAPTINREAASAPSSSPLSAPTETGTTSSPNTEPTIDRDAACTTPF